MSATAALGVGDAVGVGEAVGVGANVTVTTAGAVVAAAVGVVWLGAALHAAPSARQADTTTAERNQSLMTLVRAGTYAG
jgi:hypothetical protein